MNAYDVIITRRSTRIYRSEPVEEEKLKKVVEAGRYAPSGGNSQTNHFFVIQNPEILANLKSMVETAFAKMEVYEGMYRSLRSSITQSKKGGYSFCYDAPVLIVVANQKDYGNNMADCACALENMMLMANELDLGSCWINQLRWLNEEPAILAYMKKLGMLDSERVYGGMIVGYAATEDGKPNRKPLERKGNEVVYL